MIYVTTTNGRGRGSHKHTLYLPEPQQIQQLGIEQANSLAKMSENNKHVHEIVFDPELGQWMILEANKHTHELEEMLQEADLPKQPDKELVDDTYSLLCDAMKRENKCLETAKKCVKYYKGDQWDEGDVAKLKANKRPSISVNVIAPIVDRLSGYNRRNLPDPTAYPVEGGDDKVGEIITRVIKRILSWSNQKKLLASVFDDQIVAGRGIFNINVENDGNENHIMVERDKYNSVFYGSHDEIDLSDCQYLAKTKYLSKYEIELQFPEHAEKLEQFMENPKDYISVMNGHEVSQRGDDYDYPDEVDTYPFMLGEACLYDQYRKQYMIAEVERKIDYTTYFIGLPEYAEPMRIKASEKKDIENMGIKVTKTQDYTIRKDIVCGDVVIESINTERKRFTTIPSYSKLVDGEWYSKLKDVLDLQDETNKRFSQTTDILNRMAGYNWIYDGDCFNSKREEENFKNNVSTPGSVIKVADMNVKRPIKEEGVKFPSEVINLEELSIQRLSAQFGDIGDIPGQQSELSSRAMLLKERYGLLVNEILFNNFHMAIIELSKSLLECIQSYMTPVQILRIIRSGSPQSQEEIMADKMEDIEILKMLTTADLTKYDIELDTVSSSPTYRESQFELLAGLRQSGFPIPLESVIETGAFPNKDKMLGQLQAQQQQQSQEASATYQQEVDKTLTAQGVDPKTGMPLDVMSQLKLVEAVKSGQISLEDLQAVGVLSNLDNQQQK